IGAPLNAKPLPTDLAWLVAQERTVADAWTDIQNHRITDTAIGDLKRSRQEISARIAGGTYLPDDLARLSDLNAKINSELTTLSTLRVGIEHIRVMLDARRFQQKGN